MSDPFDVVVVGELNPDLILGREVTPEFGQVEKLVDDASLVIGSSSAIFACGAARLGLRVAFLGKVGDDIFGRFMLDELSARGIDTSGAVIDRAIKTGLGVILCRGRDRAILTFAGSIAALSYDDLDLAVLDRARHLHLGSYFLQDQLRPGVPALFDAAHAHGLTVSLDTNYDPAERWDGGVWEAVRRADIFLPNQTELCAIAGRPELNAAMDSLSEVVSILVVKLGVRGAVARVGGQAGSAEPLAVQAVDTVGAGDSFDAGFVYGYLAGWEASRALRFACICGSLSTQAVGGAAAQPTLAEAITYL